MTNANPNSNERERATRFFEVLDAFTESFARNPVITTSPKELRDSVAREMLPYGALTLYRYQRFSPRNLCNIMSGLLHMGRADDFNDADEALQAFDSPSIKAEIDSITTEGFINGIKKYREIADDNCVKAMGITDDLIAESAGRAIAARSDFFELINETLPEIRHSFRDFLWCSCLSEHRNSSKMWREYADAGTGFIARYDLGCAAVPILFVNGENHVMENHTGLLCPVAYDAPCDLTKLAAVYYISIVPGLDAAIANAQFMLALNLLTHKAPFWSAESEWRIVSLTNTQGGTCPYALVKPSELILGPAMGEADSKLLVDLGSLMGIPVNPAEREIAGPSNRK